MNRLLRSCCEKDANITLSPASEEQDVLAVLSKVEAGVADAGLVYVTDARSVAVKFRRSISRRRAKPSTAIRSPRSKMPRMPGSRRHS